MLSIRPFAITLLLLSNSYAVEGGSFRSRNLNNEEKEQETNTIETKGRKCRNGGIKSKDDEKKEQDDASITESTKCSVCGAGKEVTAPNEPFVYPNQQAISCALLQTAGNSGYIKPEECEPIASSTEIDVCQCEFIDKELEECSDVMFNINCESPSVPNDADSMIVEGIVRMEMTAKSDDAIIKLNSAIEEAVLSIGCNVSNYERMLQDTDEVEMKDESEEIVEDIDEVVKKNESKETVSFNGLKVNGLVRKSGVCTKSGAEDECILLESPISVYYGGNATDDHLKSIMYSISDSIITKSNEGKYDEFASVYYIEAKVTEDSNDNSVGLIVGIVIALGLLVGYYGYMCCRRRKQRIARVIPHSNEEKVYSEKEAEKEIAKGSSSRSVKSNEEVMSVTEHPPMCGINMSCFDCGSTEKA